MSLQGGFETLHSTQIDLYFYFKDSVDFLTDRLPAPGWRCHIGAFCLYHPTNIFYFYKQKSTLYYRIFKFWDISYNTSFYISVNQFKERIN